jgi:hypothetical protein
MNSNRLPILTAAIIEASALYRGAVSKVVRHALGTGRLVTTTVLRDLELAGLTREQAEGLVYLIEAYMVGVAATQLGFLMAVVGLCPGMRPRTPVPVDASVS